MSPELEKRIKAARLDLVLDAPFFGTLAFKLKAEASDKTPTAATDGRKLFINPDYVAKLSKQQLAGLFVEAVGHCAMGHLWRAGDRNSVLWDLACDQAIWDQIDKLQNTTNRRIALPPSAIFDPTYDNMAAEEIFHLMRQNQEDGSTHRSPCGILLGSPTPPPEEQEKPKPKPPQSKPSKSESQPPQPPDPAEPLPPPPPGDEPPCSLEDDWKSAVVQAALIEAQKGQGSMPGWLQHIIDELNEPRIPWQELIREFCHKLTRSDFSMRRPNQRHLNRGIILPTQLSETLGPIVTGFDTSGSIFGMEELVRDLLSELQGVLDFCKPEKMLMLSCDTQIHQRVEFFPGDDLRDFHPEGGGGTDFRPIFDEIATLDEPPACLIFLTDLYGTFPDEEPPYPVLWANWGHPGNKAPFGTTIDVPIPT